MNKLGRKTIYDTATTHKVTVRLTDKQYAAVNTLLKQYDCKNPSELLRFFINYHASSVIAGYLDNEERS